MDKQTQKHLDILQVILIIILILAAIKVTWNRESKFINIESCKPLGCMEQNNASQHQAAE